MGQKSFLALLYLSWACELLKSLPTLLLRRDSAHLYHLFLLVQVDPLDLLVQEVLGVHKHIWDFMFSFRWGRGVRGGRRIISVPVITRVRIIISSSSSLITISSGRAPSFTWEFLIPTSSSRRVSSTPISWWVIDSNWPLTSSCIITPYLGNSFFC